jgi:hypothetical protein
MPCVTQIFFKELARIAPHVTHLFRRPKRIQALQFINVINMLVSFNHDPETFFDDLRPLTIRHIKYGCKADYARPFGMAILNGVQISLGDRYVDARVWKVFMHIVYVSVFLCGCVCMICMYDLYVCMICMNDLYVCMCV